VKQSDPGVFSRKFRGYAPAAVDAHIEVLLTKQQLLLDDVESLRARLKGSGDEMAALRDEVAVLTDTSPAPHAVQQRVAKNGWRRCCGARSRTRAKTQSAIEEAWQDAQQREQLLTDAEQEAEHYREQARRAVDEASRQRIQILEQLMGVYRDPEEVPAALGLAYHEEKNSSEAIVVVPLDQKISTG
jgi:cell division septum initiation protein DivIVA